MLTCLFLSLLACCDAFVPNRYCRRVPSRHYSTADSDAEYFSLSGSVWSIAAELTGLRAAAAELAGPTVAIRLAIRLEPPDAEGPRFVSLGGTGALGRVTQGFVWDVDVDEESGERFVRASVKVERLAPTVPDGNLYLNARLRAPEGGRGLRLDDGVATVKVVRPGGLLADFRTVGTFDSEPLAALPPYAPPPPPLRAEPSGGAALSPLALGIGVSSLALVARGALDFGLKASGSGSFGETFYGLPVVDLDFVVIFAGANGLGWVLSEFVRSRRT